MTIRDLIRSYSDSFKIISDTPELDARVIVCHFLGLEPAQLFLRMDDAIPEDLLGKLESALKRRQSGEPVAYITGERGFYECTFKVSDSTLIPRADTETLVEDSINTLKSLFCESDEIKILDLCCGTGCIGISVAKALAGYFKRISLTLSDLSDKALEICRTNADSLITEKNISVSVIRSNMFKDIRETAYDVILSNPPYIRSSVIPGLEKQVQFEPHMALDGGEDGLDFVRIIACEASKHLVSGGFLEIEIGYDQGEDSALLLAESGYRGITVLKDLGGNDRVVKAIN
ncbi:MAG: peptide chain release factor N(5)-glutamine methyltransferase [Spirochaetales bacterium]|nr:peptide chain release factor N(5)-glutamine methyltransferase [Spirochaetales bacterium]